MKKKIIFFMGTRPEAIKMIPVALYLRNNTNHKILICSTGQHKELLNNVFQVFKIKPDIKFTLYNSSNSLNIILSKIYKSVSKILKEVKPDLALVHGDTANSMICSLAAFNEKIKIAHVEAGLRSFDNKSPWPEEVYRKLISNMSDYHFCPTNLNLKNLVMENIPKKNILITGNTVIDSVNHILKITKKNKIFASRYIKYTESIDFLKANKNIIVTIHRREKYGNNIKYFCKEIIKISKLKVKIYITLHHNPNIRGPLIKRLTNKKNIFLIEPVDYDLFINLLKDSYLVISDSGGIQEELTVLKKPLLVIRDKTERLEALDVSKSMIVGDDCSKLYSKTKILINSKNYYSRFTKISKVYGQGDASKKIAKFLNKI